MFPNQKKMEISKIKPKCDFQVSIVKPREMNAFITQINCSLKAECQDHLGL